ncbi:MAG: hypothetical protein WCB51_09765 [Candidatus Dormiibacterota bacterium]
MNRRLCSRLVFVAFALAACGTSATTPPWFVREYRGFPSGESPTQPGAALVDTVVWGAADQIAVVTFGSSTCPKLPVDLVTSTGNALTITVSSGSSPVGAACTADYGPTTSIIRVPESIDQAEQVGVTLIDGADRTTFMLPPRLPPA